LPVFDERPARALFDVDPRATERPARSRRQVDAQVAVGRMAECRVECGEPFAAQVPADAILLSLRLVDRLDLDTAESVVGELVELVGQPVLGDGTAQPPPADPRPRVTNRIVNTTITDRLARAPESATRRMPGRRRRSYSSDGPSNPAAPCPSPVTERSRSCPPPRRPRHRPR